MKVSQPYHLFLDDDRSPKSVTWVSLPPVHWTIVRNYKEFVDCITTNGLPSTISFDHDLAFEHYPFSGENTTGRVIPYLSYKEPTGYHCAKWLVDYCMSKHLNLPKWYVHTLNKQGKKNIVCLLHDFILWQDKLVDKITSKLDPIITSTK